MRRVVYSIGVSVAGILWLSLICVGLGRLWRYDNTVGIAARPPASWPLHTQLQRTPGHATLLLFAHPHCPCTRASIGELALLMARCQGKLSATVLFYRPNGFPDGWAKSDLWSSAAAIPSVHVLSDPDGGEARRFGVATSGQALLYDENGRVVFQGGITSSRGHSGDNFGRSAIVALMTGGRAEQAQTPVFGCSLLGITSHGSAKKDR